jgi:hypothetical protein
MQIYIKPPILIELINAADAAKNCGIECGTILPPIRHNAPAAVIPLIAFVTDMSGLQCKL